MSSSLHSATTVHSNKFWLFINSDLSYACIIPTRNNCCTYSTLIIACRARSWVFHDELCALEHIHIYSWNNASHALATGQLHDFHYALQTGRLGFPVVAMFSRQIWWFSSFYCFFFYVQVKPGVVLNNKLWLISYCIQNLNLKKNNYTFPQPIFFDTDNCSIYSVVGDTLSPQQTNTFSDSQASSQQISLRINIFTLLQEILQLFSHHIAGVATHMLPGFLI